MKAGHKSRNLAIMGVFFCRQDLSISIFGRTKEFSEVCGTSLMCNFGVGSRFRDVIYVVRPPNGIPDSTTEPLHLLVCKVLRELLEHLS